MNSENMIEFINGEKTATITFNSRRHITKVKKLYEKDPDSFDYFIENKDGSICAKVPISWIKVGKPRQMSEEQKQAASDRLKNFRAKNDF